ncbi:MAG: hypothetical protein AAGM27_02230 [Cyanobacteria bacterium J06554_3]
MLNAFNDSRYAVSPSASDVANDRYGYPRLNAVPTLASNSNEDIVANWLETLLRHFGIHQLDAISEQELASLLTDADESNAHALRNSALIAELKRRIIRLAGAQLGDVFVDMAADVIDEQDAAATSLLVEGRRLHGIRYQGEIYRLIEDFAPCHRLRAYCLAQTLSEQSTAHIITRSHQRFAVWVNVKALPTRRLSI